MKGVLVCCLVSLVSLSVFAQTEKPSWVTNWFNSGVEFAEVCELVGRSDPLPNNTLERRMMALYEALYDYSSMRCTHVEGGTYYKTESYIDYTLLDSWVDEEGREYVLVNIYPGSHHFFAENIWKEDDTDSKEGLLGSSIYYYNYSAFAYPMIYGSLQYRYRGKDYYRSFYSIGNVKQVF